MLGIVLSRRDTHEVDQVISLYTDTLGKIEILARSIKKITSKNSSHVEPYTLVDVDTTPGREREVLTSVQPIESFREVRNNFFKHASALYIVRTIDAICKAGEQDETLFALLHNTLQEMNTVRQWAFPEMDQFFLRCISQLGFKPSVEVLKKKDQYLFSFAEGSIVDQPKSGQDVFLLTESLRSYIQSVTQEDTCLASEVDQAQFHDFVFRFFQFHIGLPTTDWKEIEKIAL